MLCFSNPHWPLASAIEYLEGDASFGNVGTSTAAGFPYTVSRYRDSATLCECRIESVANIQIRAECGMIGHENIRRVDRSFAHAAVVECLNQPVLDVLIHLRVNHRRSWDPCIGFEF